MIDSQMYAHLREQANRHQPQARAHESKRHRGLQRSAREISLSVRRQRRHGEPA